MDFQTANSFLNGKPKKEGTNNEKNYEGLCHGKKPVFFSRFPHYSLFVIHSSFFFRFKYECAVQCSGLLNNFLSVRVFVITKIDHLRRHANRDRVVRYGFQNKRTRPDNAMSANVCEYNRTFTDPGIFTDRDAGIFSSLLPNRNVCSIKKMLIRAVRYGNSARQQHVIPESYVPEDTIRPNVNIFTDFRRWVRENRPKTDAGVFAAAGKDPLQKRKPKILAEDSRHNRQKLCQISKNALLRQKQTHQFH